MNSLLQEKNVCTEKSGEGHAGQQEGSEILTLGRRPSDRDVLAHPTLPRVQL